MRGRPGGSLAELLLVASLFGVVLAGVASFASAQSRLLARAHDTTRAEAVVRTASVVLDAELRGLAPEDISAISADSVRLRAVRGGGVVCAADSLALVVRYRGIRSPNPAKDSVLVIRSDATAGRVRRIEAVGSDARCGGAVRLHLDGPAGPAGWALVFETGAYHVVHRSVRYRRGRGGRQSLTEELLQDGAFRSGSDAVRLELRFDSASLPRLDSGAVSPVLRLPGPVVP
jgi:hypothetical protein